MQLAIAFTILAALAVAAPLPVTEVVDAKTGLAARDADPEPQGSAAQGGSSTGWNGNPNGSSAASGNQGSAGWYWSYGSAPEAGVAKRVPNPQGSAAQGGSSTGWNGNPNGSSASGGNQGASGWYWSYGSAPEAGVAKRDADADADAGMVVHAPHELGWKGPGAGRSLPVDAVEEKRDAEADAAAQHGCHHGIPNKGSVKAGNYPPVYRALGGACQTVEKGNWAPYARDAEAEADAEGQASGVKAKRQDGSSSTGWNGTGSGSGSSGGAGSTGFWIPQAYEAGISKRGEDTPAPAKRQDGGSSTGWNGTGSGSGSSSGGAGSTGFWIPQAYEAGISKRDGNEAAGKRRIVYEEGSDAKRDTAEAPAKRQDGSSSTGWNGTGSGSGSSGGQGSTGFWIPQAYEAGISKRDGNEEGSEAKRDTTEAPAKRQDGSSSTGWNGTGSGSGSSSGGAGSTGFWIPQAYEAGISRRNAVAEGAPTEYPGVEYYAKGVHVAGAKRRFIFGGNDPSGPVLPPGFVTAATKRQGYVYGGGPANVNNGWHGVSGGSAPVANAAGASGWNWYGSAPEAGIARDLKNGGGNVEARDGDAEVQARDAGADEPVEA